MPAPSGTSCGARCGSRSAGSRRCPKVGSFLTYDILDDSIIVVRTGPDTLKAHHNVCMHRGRRLVDTPDGAKNACGHKKSFVCGFHGWTYDLDGDCTHIPEQQDWQGALTAENTHLAPVNVDTWGGWIWINMDPDCEPLRDYLEPAATMLDPFELAEHARQMAQMADLRLQLEGRDGGVQRDLPRRHHAPGVQQVRRRSAAGPRRRASTATSATTRPRVWTRPSPRSGSAPADPRISTAEMQVYTLEETNATTTKTLVDAAKRLVDELPEGTPADQVLEHWLASARRDDEARGVVWPTIDPEHLARAAPRGRSSRTSRSARA